MGATDDIERSFFGQDLLFTDDLQVSSAGDYLTVEGYDSLKQAIRNRLITAPGEYAVRPDYGVGLGKWVKRRATKSDKDALRQLIIDQLAKEDRIQKVEDVLVESLTSGNTTGIKVTIRVTALGKENSFAFTTFSE